jgi:hypothetical protein
MTWTPGVAALAAPAPQPEFSEFYRRVLQVISGVSLQYLIGGTHALKHQTGLPFDPRDFDVLLRRADMPLAAQALNDAGHPVVMAHPHFVAKVYDGDRFVDLIFGSGNGLTDLDDEWFAHGSEGVVFDVPVRFCSAEDLLWSKAFIMERERYDGADVAHMLLTCGHRLDWVRLVARFGQHWRVLLSHLIMFGFVYPGERGIVPAWVLDDLLARLERERNAAPEASRVCQGTLVSRLQYLIDLRHLGLADARLEPEGPLTREDVDHWTAAAEAEARRKS